MQLGQDVCGSIQGRQLVELLPGPVQGLVSSLSSTKYTVSHWYCLNSLLRFCSHDMRLLVILEIRLEFNLHLRLCSLCMLIVAAGNSHDEK